MLRSLSSAKDGSITILFQPVEHQSSTDRAVCILPKEQSTSESRLHMLEFDIECNIPKDDYKVSFKGGKLKISGLHLWKQPNLLKISTKWPTNIHIYPQ